MFGLLMGVVFLVGVLMFWSNLVVLFVAFVRWAVANLRRILGVAISCALMVSVVAVQRPLVAHASVKEWIIERVIMDIAKRVFGNRDMSDDDLKEKVEEGVDRGFREYDEYVSDEETKERISNHCWRVYWTSLHPEQAEWNAYNDGLLPHEYVDDWGNTFNELEVCVRTGYVPRPDKEGTIDSE